MNLPERPNEERWATLPLSQQMANIGSEVGRTANWIAKGKDNIAEGAFIRALDLYDLTIKYGRLGQNARFQLLFELCRSRDLFVDAYLSKNIENMRLEERYFYHFAIS